MEQLNPFEVTFLDQWLLETGVAATVDGDCIAFDLGSNQSETFRRVVTLHALVALDLANEEIGSDRRHGYKNLSKLANVLGAEVVEVYTATIHVVRPLESEIMKRFLANPSLAQIISDAAGECDQDMRI